MDIKSPIWFEDIHDYPLDWFTVWGHGPDNKNNQYKNSEAQALYYLWQYENKQHFSEYNRPTKGEELQAWFENFYRKPDYNKIESTIHDIGPKETSENINAGSPHAFGNVFYKTNFIDFKKFPKIKLNLYKLDLIENENSDINITLDVASRKIESIQSGVLTVSTDGSFLINFSNSPISVGRTQSNYLINTEIPLGRNTKYGLTLSLDINTTNLLYFTLGSGYLPNFEKPILILTQ